MNDKCEHYRYCDQCKKLREENKKYKKTIDLIMENINKYGDNNNNINNSLYESIIIENARYTNNVSSNTGENYVLLEQFKSHNDMTREELNSIQNQTDYANYNNSIKYITHSMSVYGLLRTATGIGRYLFGFI